MNTTKKKRKHIRLIPVFLFVALAVVGVLGLLMPRQPGDFEYKNINTSRHTGFDRYGFDVTFEIINNSNKVMEDATIAIEYIVSQSFNDIDCGITLISDINEGKNKISFSHDESNFGVYLFEKVDKITISYNGKTYEVEKEGKSEEPKWYHIVFVAVGVVGAFISFFTWIASGITDTAKEVLTSATNSTTSSSAPPKKKEKIDLRGIECDYCKCRYDAEREFKCPNCGATPDASKYEDIDFHDDHDDEDDD